MEQTPADKRSLSAPALLLIYLALCLLSAAVLLLLRRAGRVSAAAAGGAEGILRSMTLDVIAKLYMPVLICDDAGKIIWYNKALANFTIRARRCTAGIWINSAPQTSGKF